MDGLFLMTTFRLYSVLELSFEHISVHKNLFPSARFRWDARSSLRQMDQKLKFG